MPDDRARRLEEFVAWSTAHVTGDEKGQAQIFLDRFFQALGHKGCLEVGGTSEFRVRKGQEAGGGIAFADYVWKPYVLIEMKKRGEDLSRHYRQAFDYWLQLVPGRPRYVILCNFDEFWVYDFETQMDTPVDQVPLPELPERFGPLAFLFPSHDRPVFGNDHEEVTRKAADLLARCFNKLVTRKVPRDVAQRFTLQMLVALFAEDIGLLEKYFVTRLLDDCKSPTDSFDLLGGLFEAMNMPQRVKGGRFKAVQYFNGGLFQTPARLELYDDELNQLREAAKSDWSKVRPEIFGTLFEHSLEKEERHAYGGHFTHPTDIMKIVGPTIVQPWRDLIENAKTAAQLKKLRERMQGYRVLDPACGSGNFLYIAYRELKRLEARLFERLAEHEKKQKGQAQLGFVTARQFFGLDINPFAIEIAKVTMMIARKLAIDELHIHEEPLPLDRLDDNFIAGDALITPYKNGEPFPTTLFAELEVDPWAVGRIVPTPWPKADVIIGNPPFLDARKLTIEHGRTYVGQLEKTYPEVPRRADYCTYWIRRAHDHLVNCTIKDPIAGRAGLVGTQNIRNNEAREGGLDYVVESGTIVEAVDNQPWSGEANVHVSIVNWVRTEDSKLVPKKRRLWSKVNPPPERTRIRKRGEGPASKEYELSSRECAHINSALSDEVDLATARGLKVNREPKVCFEGQQPGHKGFRIGKPEYELLLESDRKNRVLLHPYITGTSLLTSRFRIRPEFIIDFGDRDLLAASAFPAALQLVRSRVLPKWRANAESERAASGKRSGEHQRRMQTWWLLKRPRNELLRAISKLGRYIVCSRVTKRPVFVFLSSRWRPDSSLTAFAFEDDYSFGVLQSTAHWSWFTAKCSKLKSDFRYTPDSVFDTFPWPQKPAAKSVRSVAKAARHLRRVRDGALKETAGGLRVVYRSLELPGWNLLREAQTSLDEAVIAAYRFSLDDDLLTQLLALNFETAHRIDDGKHATPPGIPSEYPTPEDLVTEDCIRA